MLVIARVVTFAASARASSYRSKRRNLGSPGANTVVFIKAPTESTICCLAATLL